MLDSSVGKLYALLTACKPDNAKIQKRLLIIEIMEMSQYKSLYAYKGAFSVMRDWYSENKLQEASYEQLKEVKQIIPFIEDCIRKLNDVVNYADVRVLRTLRKPDFYNAASMKNLYELVTNLPNSGVNITNLTEDNIWDIFSEDTIYSLDNYKNLKTVNNLDKLEIRITEKFKNETYCISANEISEIRNTYRSLCKKRETLRLRIQIVENKALILKSIVSLASIIVVMLCLRGSMYYFPPIGRVFAVLIYLLGLAVYWIMG